MGNTIERARLESQKGPRLQLRADGSGYTAASSYSDPVTRDHRLGFPEIASIEKENNKGRARDRFYLFFFLESIRIFYLH